MEIFHRSINPGEVKVPITFDFTARADGSAIVSVAFDVGVWNEGTDATPDHFDPAAAVIVSAVVTRLWTGGVAGCDYRARCRATFANGRTRSLTAIIPVRNNA